MLPLPNLGTLGRSIREMGGSAMGIARRFNSEFAGVGGYRSLFANRTALGAMAGGAIGAYRGDNYSASSIAGGALAGAGIARYGGMFARTGMTSGMGMRTAAKRTAAIMRHDARAAGRFIGTSRMSANRGINKIRGLFR